jgi:hypothetical protein
MVAVGPKLLTAEGPVALGGLTGANVIETEGAGAVGPVGTAVGP